MAIFRKKSTGPAVKLPKNIQPVGDTEGSVKVYIKQDVYRDIEEYSALDIHNEAGSILLGQHLEDENGMHIIISEYIEAKYTDATASSLTFTHDTWDYVHTRHEKRCPEKIILGWHHTHPGYDVFLSSYDMFIQENFFDLPFQTAYVVDPVKDSRGFFAKKEGVISQLDGFFIYDDDNKKPVKLPSAKQTKEKGTVSLPSALLYAGLGLLLLTTLVSVFSLFILLT
ncbi:MAG: hypothetical protein IJ017_06390 [Oscillospiraceae bacterium]|nr:hypothetical protein [Oscillospiraceae bacterium]